MVEDMWAYDEIVVEVGGFFTTEHVFRSEAGTLAVLKVSLGMTEGSYAGGGGRRIVVRRTGWLSRGYELIDGDTVRGAAAPRGAFKQGYRLRFAGQELELVPRGFFQREWLLVDAGDRVVLRLAPRGAFKRGARLLAPDPIEFPLAVLAYYLYQVVQQEAAAVAATAAS